MRVQVCPCLVALEMRWRASMYVYVCVCVCVGVCQVGVCDVYMSMHVHARACVRMHIISLCCLRLVHECESAFA